VASYDRAIALKPRDAGAWCVRGNALRRLGRYEEAVSSYDQAIAIDPDYPGAKQGREIALQNKK
jgi:tetratricopeptide (TPR) repeat protein